MADESKCRDIPRTGARLVKLVPIKVPVKKNRRSSW